MNDSKNIVLEFAKAAVHLNKNQILKDVDIKISKGDFVYFFGENGSGKSSLLKCIYAELPISSGTASVLEYQLNQINDSVPMLRRRLGIVSPEYPLISHLNLQENLMLVLKATGWKDKSAALSKITELLIKFGLKDKQSSGISSLSRAEKIRALIVRALLNSPSVLILDEPTAGLDDKAEAELMKLLQELNVHSKLTIITASSKNSLQSQYPGKAFYFADRTVKPA